MEQEKGKESTIWLEVGPEYRLQATAGEHLQCPNLYETETRDADAVFEDAQVRSSPFNRLVHLMLACKPLLRASDAF